MVQLQHRRSAIWVSVLSVMVTLALCIAVVYYWDYVREVQNWGYLGILVISIFAGATMIVPVPALPIVFTMGSILNPAAVGAAAGFGEAIGAIFIYLQGYGGRAIVPDVARNRYVAKLITWVERRGTVAIFMMSSVFDPFFYPVTVAIGMLKFQIWKFFLATWAGKTVKGMIVAYLGYLGLGAILRAFGIAV
ncbi:MAG: VTT domain-containing protein [Chloroflexota bacterium]